MITDRLLEVAKYTSDNSKIIDVGCDHALLDIYIYLNRKNVNILGVDISENSINVAHKNLDKYGVINKIELKVSDGLKNVSVNSFDTIIMSGLGGRTMIKILEKRYLSTIEKIILQPNNNSYDLRKYMSKVGYKIADESLVFDNKILYPTIVFEKGRARYNFKQLYLGPILLKKREKKLKFKLEKELKVLKNILKHKEKISFFRKIKLIFKFKILEKEYKRFFK